MGVTLALREVWPLEQGSSRDLLSASTLYKPKLCDFGLATGIGGNSTVSKSVSRTPVSHMTSRAASVAPGAGTTAYKVRLPLRLFHSPCS